MKSESNTLKPTNEEIKEANELLRKYERGNHDKGLIELVAEHEATTGINRDKFKEWKIGKKRQAGISANTIGKKIDLLAAIIREETIDDINANKVINLKVKNFQDALKICWQTYKMACDYRAVFTWPPHSNEKDKPIETVEIKKRKKSSGNSLVGTKWAVYFLYYKDEGQKFNDGLIGRAIIDIKHDGENGVVFTNTELDDVVDYEGCYTSHTELTNGIVIFDLEADSSVEKGRNIHIKVYCRNRNQELLIGQYTTYEKGCIQSGNIIFQNITDEIEKIKPGVFSWMFNNGRGYDTTNIPIEFIKFLSIRAESYNNAQRYQEIKSKEILGEYLKTKRQHDYLRFERFLERVRPKAFLASTTSFAKNSGKDVLEKIEAFLNDKFKEKIYVSSKPHSLAKEDIVDQDGYYQPYRDIEKLKRTRFFVLLLDDVKELSYSYLQLGIAMTVCKVVVVIGKRENMSESILNMRTGVINKIIIEGKLEEEMHIILPQLYRIMKKSLPITLGGVIKPRRY